MNLISKVSREVEYNVVLTAKEMSLIENALREKYNKYIDSGIESVNRHAVSNLLWDLEEILI